MNEYSNIEKQMEDVRKFLHFDLGNGPYFLEDFQKLKENLDTALTAYEFTRKETLEAVSISRRDSKILEEVIGQNDTLVRLIETKIKTGTIEFTLEDIEQYPILLDIFPDLKESLTKKTDVGN